jgi:hypothetical protein
MYVCSRRMKTNIQCVWLCFVWMKTFVVHLYNHKYTFFTVALVSCREFDYGTLK